MSSYVVCQPFENAFEIYREQQVFSKRCVCHTIWSFNDTIRTPVDHIRVKKLWLWAQTRLAGHLTMNNAVKFSLSQLNFQDTEHKQKTASVIGDLTVMVSAILPFPHKNDHTPRGVVRVWDGTGASRSDQ